MTEPAQREELKNTGYEIFVGLLSILSIVNIVLLYVIDDPNLDTVLVVMNGILSVIFLADFTYRLFTAESKSRYFFREFGWADLLASLPVAQVKILRVFRLVRVFRLLRVYGVKNIGRSLINDRAGSALVTLLLMGILVLQFGSLEILHIEQHAPNANIKTGSDALWYVIVTISTVGYGDRYPVTNNGRIFGSLIILIGVGIFGTFTGYLANLFLGSVEDAHHTSTNDAGRHAIQGQRTKGAHGSTTGRDGRDRAPPPVRADLTVPSRSSNAQLRFHRGRLAGFNPLMATIAAHCADCLPPRRWPCFAILDRRDDPLASVRSPPDRALDATRLDRVGTSSANDRQEFTIDRGGTCDRSRYTKRDVKVEDDDKPIRT